ncbi:MAG TPA: hypothetical protein PLX79_02045 [Candidatus Dojkabacteria bacterium]|nr:hypothetical protein [Candidatus Dojkabacteria bacterium]
MKKKDLLRIILIWAFILLIYLSVFLLSFFFYKDKEDNNVNEVIETNVLFPLTRKENYKNIFWIDEKTFSIASEINQEINTEEILSYDEKSDLVIDFSDAENGFNNEEEYIISDTLNKANNTTLLEIYDTDSRELIKKIIIDNAQIVGIKNTNEIVNLNDVGNISTDRENIVDSNSPKKIREGIDDSLEVEENVFSENVLIICNYKNNIKNTESDFGTEIETIVLETNISDIINTQEKEIKISEAESDINESEPNHVDTFPTITTKYERNKFFVVPTLKIDKCSNNLIYLSSAYPFQEQKYYEYDTENDSLKEMTDNTYSLSGESEIKITKNQNSLFNINKYNDIKEYRINQQENRVALVSSDGTFYIYIRE